MSVLQRDPSEQVQILTEEGQVRADATVPELSDDQLVEMYRQLKLGRHFDERAVSLQRQGRMGTYPPLSGQEAAQIGSAHALADEDWVYPSYREHMVAYQQGLPLEDILLYWMGSEDGKAPPEDVNVFTLSVPIATQLPHATGAAWASKLQGENNVHVCYFGDGATSEGDFHEGMNFAGVFDAPVLFFCENNNWAISLPRRRQTAAETIAQKAHAYGFSGGQVDGNDPLAVREMVASGLASVREGEPALIESLTYRQGAHTTSDDPDRYRDREGDLPDWRTADPLDRYEEYLIDQGAIDGDDREAFREEADEELERAIERVETVEAEDPAEPGDVFEHVYDVPTDRLRRQREWLSSFAADNDLQELDH